MLINQSALRAVTTGFKTVFNGALAAAPSHWQRVAMLVPSGHRSETYAWLGAIPRLREWVGERVVQNLRAHDYTIKNRSFEATIGVDRNDIEDDSYAVYAPFIAQLAEEAKSHPDELVFGLLKNGFTEKGYDGQNFFDTDHPVVDEAGAEQSVSNLGGGAGEPWFLLDVSRAVKPLIFQRRRDYTFTAMDKIDDERVFMRREFRYGIDARVNAGFGLWQLAYASRQPLDATSYGDARAAMMSFKADGGRPLNIRPTLLVVPPSLERAGLEVLKAEHTAAGATNVYKDSADLLVTQWLA
ncbi:MAG TPA: Mu-like prophage major head subunit gpT family protein [Longimicrobiales bacterium]